MIDWKIWLRAAVVIMAEGDAGARAAAQAFRKMQLEGSVFAVAVILDEGLLSLLYASLILVCMENPYKNTK